MATNANFEANLKPGLKVVSSNHTARLPEPPSANGRMRRKITREQGCALEVIGHAVDYLNDSYLYEGADDEIIDFSGPSMDAVRILISAQRQILSSLPLAEPLPQRFWNTLLRRKSQFKASTVVPLSSSR